MHDNITSNLLKSSEHKLLRLPLAKDFKYK